MKDFSMLALNDAVVGFPGRIGIITRLDGPIIRFSDSELSGPVDGDTYPVVPGLQVSAVKQTGTGETPSCALAAVHSTGGVFDSAAIDLGLFDGAKVQIYYVNRKNLLAGKGLLFTGQIANTAVDPRGHGVVFDVKGLAAWSRILMTRKRAPDCQTELFSSLCTLNRASYAVATTVASIVDGYRFTVTGALAQASGYFNQGTMKTADGKAFVVGSWDQSTQTIMTYRPSNRFLSVGLGLTLYPGCDKTMGPDGCPKFGNQANYQGELHWTGAAASAQQVL